MAPVITPDPLWWTPADVEAADHIVEASRSATFETQRKADNGLNHLARRCAYLAGQVRGFEMSQAALIETVKQLGDALRIARQVQAEAIKPKKRRRR